jgi:transcription initiation factor TFIIIB Brf1 subunit/transcription initiation factor TFIIB
LNEICLSADLEKKKVTKCFRKIQKSLKIHMTNSEAANFSNRFVDDLGLDQGASRLVG